MKKTIITTIMAAMFSVPAFADCIEEIVSLVRTNNLDIKAIEAETDAADRDIRSTNNLKDTSFDFEYLFGNSAVGDKWGIGVAQEIDWPGLYSSRGKANASRISALNYLGEWKCLTILVEAKRICLEIIDINKQICLNNRIVADMSQIKDAYDKGFDHGEISVLDVNKLKIEMLNTNRRTKELAVKRRQLTERLKALNGNNELPSGIVDNLTEYPAVHLSGRSVYEERMMQHDPERMYYSMLDEAEERQVSVTKMQQLPSFSVGYKYAYELGDKFNGFTVGVSLPLFSSRNKVASAKARKISAQFARQSDEVAKTSQMMVWYDEATELKGQIDEYKAVLGDKTNVKLLRKALDAGQISLLDYLMEMRYFIDAHNQLLELELRYNNLIVDIDKYSLL